MIGLALAGGGVKGSYQEGVLTVLLRNKGMHFDAIAGVSVGALNGAFLAQYTRGREHEASEGLEALWADLATHKVYQNWRPFGKLMVPWKPSVYSTKPLRKMLRRHVNADLIRASGRIFSVGAVNLATGEYEDFPSNHPRILDAVLASASFPIMFPPVKIDGAHYIDGGVRNVTPIQTLFSAGCDKVIAIVPHPTKPGPGTGKSVIDVASRTVDIMMSELINSDIHACAHRSSITVIRPKMEIAEDSLEFSPTIIRELRDMGIRDALEIYGS